MNKFMFLVLFVSSSAFSNALKEIEAPTFEIKKFQWVSGHLSHFLQSCLKESKDCGKQDNLLPHLNNIYANLQNNSFNHRVEFVTELQDSNRFKSDAGETHRIAVTGNTPNSTIYFNLDRIKGLSLQQMVAIYFHELAHHTGLKDDNSRLPDLIGARIAKHVNQQLGISHLDEEKAPELSSGVFQFTFPEMIDGSYSYSNFGFITDGVQFFNIDFSAFEAFPICDRKDAFPLAQEIPGPLNWSIHSGNKVFVSAAIGNTCVWVDKINRKAGKDLVMRGFHMQVDLTSDFKMIKKSITASLGEHLVSGIDYAATLQLLKQELRKANYNAAEVAEGYLILKSFKPAQFNSCDLGFSHQGSPKQHNGWPVMDSRNSECKIEKAGDNWKLSFKYKLRDKELGGEHYLSVIKLTGVGSQDTAIATFFKGEVKFLVNAHPSSINPMQVVSLSNSGLKPITQLGANKMIDSYIYLKNTPFILELKVKSKLSVELKGLMAGFLAGINGEIATVSQGGDPKDLTHYLKQVSYKNEGDYQIIQLTIQMPISNNGNQIYGLTIEDMIIIDEAGNYIGLNKVSEYQYIYLIKEFVDINQ